MEERILLRTYNKAWKFERKVYAIDDIRLPFPVNPDELVYLVCGFLFTLGILKAFPFLNGIPFVVRYLVLPYALMKFLAKKKFDGKLPHRFLIGYLDYLGLPKRMSRFQAAQDYAKGCFTPIVFRKAEIADLTAELISKNRKAGKKAHVPISD